MYIVTCSLEFTLVELFAWQFPTVYKVDLSYNIQNKPYEKVQYLLLPKYLTDCLTLSDCNTIP